MTHEENFEDWLKDRPDIIKQLAKKYPPGTCFNLHNQFMWVIGYNEDGGLSITSIDPHINYQEAVKQKIHVCKCCLDKLEECLVKITTNEN
jgi:hypothetical protein